jgi:hypothetical protein
MHPSSPTARSSVSRSGWRQQCRAVCHRRLRRRLQQPLPFAARVGFLLAVLAPRLAHRFGRVLAWPLVAIAASSACWVCVPPHHTRCAAATLPRVRDAISAKPRHAQPNVHVRVRRKRPEAAPQLSAAAPSPLAPRGAGCEVEREAQHESQQKVPTPRGTRACAALGADPDARCRGGAPSDGLRAILPPHAHPAPGVAYVVERRELPIVAGWTSATQLRLPTARDRVADLHVRSRAAPAQQAIQC